MAVVLLTATVIDRMAERPVLPGHDSGSDYLSTSPMRDHFGSSPVSEIKHVIYLVASDQEARRLHYDLTHSPSPWTVDGAAVWTFEIAVTAAAADRDRTMAAHAEANALLASHGLPPAELVHWPSLPR